VVGVTSPLWIRSPPQLAAQAQPPPMTVLTAPVERRVLRDILVVRGDVRPDAQFELTPAAGDGRAIVTAVRVRPGDRVAAGAVLAEISGRPLFLLPGTVPAYRDLKPGADGRDVAQLQAALAGLGYRSRDRRGVFGTGTKSALRAFYTSRGYEPLPVDPADDRQLWLLRRQVVAADRAVTDARAALAALAGDPGATPEQEQQAATALARAREDAATARADLAEAERVSGPMLPVNEYAFAPRFPVRVDTSRASVGQPVTAPLLTLSTGVLVVKAELTEAQRALAHVGDPVEIAGDDRLVARGTVTEVADVIGAVPTGAPGADAAGPAGAGGGYGLVVKPSAVLDDRLAGRNVRLAIEIATSGGEQLVVPVSALYAAADGRAYVTRRDPDGRETPVAVEPTLSAQGYVAIRAADGDLRPGDLVTLGVAGTP